MSGGQSSPRTSHAADDAYKAERTEVLRAFGTKLRTARVRRDLSQERLAAVASLHRTHLGALELGQREPQLTTLLILADALEVSLDTLLDGVPVPRERRAPTYFGGGGRG